MYHDNWFVALIMHQIIFLARVVFENSVLFLGLLLFNDMFTPLLAEILNYYELPLHLVSPFPVQNTFASFQFDFRNVRSPKISTQDITFYLDGQFTHKHEACYGHEEEFVLFPDNGVWRPCADVDDASCPQGQSET